MLLKRNSFWDTFRNDKSHRSGKQLIASTARLFSYRFTSSASITFERASFWRFSTVVTAYITARSAPPSSSRPSGPKIISGTISIGERIYSSPTTMTSFSRNLAVCHNPATDGCGKLDSFYNAFQYLVCAYSACWKGYFLLYR